MTVLVTRDWRGIKFHLSECTSQELHSLAANAQQTQDQIDRFVESIEAELARRTATIQFRVA